MSVRTEAEVTGASTARRSIARKSFRRWRAFEKASGLGRIGIDDQIQLAGQVVDHRQFFGQQQLDVGQAEIVFRAPNAASRFSMWRTVS